MEPELFWGLFASTGEPLVYMLYRSLEEKAEQEKEASKR